MSNCECNFNNPQCCSIYQNKDEKREFEKLRNIGVGGKNDARGDDKRIFSKGI